MRKKGVSPLVATVLIICFTVFVFGVVMIWGTDFVKSLQESTEDKAFKSMTCSSDVGLTVKKACFEGSVGIRLLVENFGSVNIESLNLRVYGDKSITHNRVPQKLEASGIKLMTTSYDPQKTGNVEKVEVVPNIKYDNEEFSCINVNSMVTGFSTCELSEIQLLACEKANKSNNSCVKLKPSPGDAESLGESLGLWEEGDEQKDNKCCIEAELCCP
ncbi:hypothetical protein FJZ53_07415 [Candidatus Woesearchaeota archaeon]|nr:hypothetical protein [Candidatus Woesearchaeota archaeon]